MKENIIKNKSFDFAVRIVKLNQYLCNNKKEFVLSKQILRSGTSIGANIHEAVGSESKKDFIHKLGIAVKEARETSYWLNLLKDSNYLPIDEFDRLNNLCDELIRILNSIILTTKERYIANS